jgi:beta-glucosidase
MKAFSMFDNESTSNLIQQIRESVDALSLEEKVELLTGRDIGHSKGNEKIGLRPMTMANGPAGVRMVAMSDSEYSINQPSPVNLAATWSRRMASEYGKTLAREAQRKAVDVLLGPTVNMHRLPGGGRNFESYSEDPLLTAALGVEVVKSIQNVGISACIKHFVCNDFEEKRYTSSAEVDEKTLREVYLRPFEEVIIEGQVWSLMSAYNSINGVTASENSLLTDPLRSEWGFDGLTIGDWTAVRSLAAANADQDLVMPGPLGPWGEALVNAVNNGEVSEDLIDVKVSRLLLLAYRVGAIDFSGKTPANRPNIEVDLKRDNEFAFKSAVDSFVLLKNNAVLPIDPGKKRRVALIGHHASLGRHQGMGSASVNPREISQLQDAFSSFNDFEFTYSLGALVHEELTLLPKESLVNPDTGVQGVNVELFDGENNLIHKEVKEKTGMLWVRGSAPIERTHFVKVSFIFTPQEANSKEFGFASAFPVEFKINSGAFLQQDSPINSADIIHLLTNPPKNVKSIDFEAGKPYLIEVQVDIRGRVGRAADYFAFTIGTQYPATDASTLISEAVDTAANSDVAVVMVGTHLQSESEGFDRYDLSLPGLQNELIEKVSAVNPNTVVVINSGTPVLMPWRELVSAILVAHLPGQEMGNAIYSVLTGRDEPGGRLPTTWPSANSPLPIENIAPDDNGKMIYSEGVNIGYRGWIDKKLEPAYFFGDGMSYTSFEAELVSAEYEAGCVHIEITVKNAGHRSGKYVAQIFARKPDSNLGRPAIWLVAFEDVVLESGESRVLKIIANEREFLSWSDGWILESGEYQLSLGMKGEVFKLKI